MMSISRSTASLDDFSTDQSRSTKLNRLSKAYSLTDLSQTRRRRSSSSEISLSQTRRRRSSSSEISFNKGTASSRSKSQLSKEESLKERTLSRITKNIEKDRNSEKKFSQAYQEKCTGVMNQTATRTENKKRDSALLSGIKQRLPPLGPSQSGRIPAGGRQQPNTGRNSTAGKQNGQNRPRARSGRPDLESAGRVVPVKTDNKARIMSGKPDISTKMRSNRSGDVTKSAKSGRAEEKPKKSFTSAVNRAAPSKTFAGTVKRAAASNKAGNRKNVDDFTLNKKYCNCVCEPCKLQIHEKLKRGYAKYKSLDSMKACEKCRRVVIDFDFYTICIECAKSTAVCAKCAAGSTKMSGARFVEVVRSGVEENLLEMSSNELKKFAQKHAKIEVVERRIDDIEHLSEEKTSGTTTRKISGKSSRANSAVTSSRAPSSKSNSPSSRKINSKLNTESPISTVSASSKEAQIARSMTSSSSPLVDKVTSGNESDEAYGSGHISSADVTTPAAKQNKRTRKKSSDILRQIRSLTSLEVTSPTLARSVIKEIRSLTAFDIDEETYSTDEEDKHGAFIEENKAYTPFSSATDKSIDDDKYIEAFAASRSSPKENLPSMRTDIAGQLEAENSPVVEDYLPLTPIAAVSSDTNSSRHLAKSAVNNYEEIINESSDEDNHKNCDYVNGSVGEIEKGNVINEIDESEDNYWIEDVDLFDDTDSDIEYVKNTDEFEIVVNGASDTVLAGYADRVDDISFTEDFENVTNDASGTVLAENVIRKDEISLTEESYSDLVENIYIEADPVKKDVKTSDNAKCNFNSDEENCTGEYIEVIEEDTVISQDNDYETEAFLQNGDIEHDILIVDFEAEDSNSSCDLISESSQPVPAKVETKESFKTKVFVIKSGDKLHVYDYEERSSSCEDIETESKEDVDRFKEALKFSQESDLQENSMIEISAQEDRPSSLTVTKGSPEEADTNDDSCNYMYNNFSRKDYERQSGEEYERQSGEEHDSKMNDSMIDRIGEGFEQFVQFHHDHCFEIVEDNGYENGYYEECYQYNTRLRIRLEDIPEEGTLSKETTYLSTVYTETFDKEDTLFGKDDIGLARDPTMEEHAEDIVNNALHNAVMQVEHAEDIVNNALHNAVIQVESCREPSR